MKNFISFLTSIIPFLSPYPLWVKYLVSIWILLTAVTLIAIIFVPKGKDSHALKTYEFKLTPGMRKLDTKIDVKMGEYITGEIDLSNPFHINTSREFPWMQEFKKRYKNQGKWIGPIKYISPSGMETYDDKGNMIQYSYPDVVLKTWGAIYFQIGENKYRIENLSIKESIINTPPNTRMKPFLVEEPGRIFIYINPHPYLEGTEGEVIIKINKND